MALHILDGNQSPTTLSTIIISNAHVPAHTVTSLGTQAITDIATAVSGVELGPNTLNALENITVTLGQVTITGGLTDAQLRASAVTVAGTVTVGSIVTHGVTIANSSVTIGGSVTATISGTPSVTFTQASVTFGTAVITGSTSILNFPATQTVTFTQASVTFGTAVITGSTSIIGTPSVTFTQASVTFGIATITGSTSILNFPATQTVTFTQITTHGVTIANTSVTVNGTFYQATQPVSLTTLPALVASTAQIGSVTASISGTPSVTFTTATITGSTSILNFPATQTVTFTQIATHGVTIGAGTAQIGSVTASISGTPSVTFTQIATHGVTIANSSVTIGGTVTASNSEWVLLGTRDWNAVTAPWFFSGMNQYSSVRLDNGGGGGSGIIAIDTTYNNDRYWKWDGDSRLDGNQILTFGGSSYTAPVQYDEINFFIQVEVQSDPNISKLYAKKNFTNLGLTNFQLRETPVVITTGIGTSVTKSNFTSTTPSTYIGTNATDRKILTVFNEGAGNLHICAGYSCTTIGYQVRLSSGDYWECPASQVNMPHVAVFASAGTARVTELY